MSSRYDVARDHIADFLIFRSSAQSFWFSLNTSYDHLATDETAVVAAVWRLWRRWWRRRRRRRRRRQRWRWRRGPGWQRQCDGDSGNDDGNDGDDGVDGVNGDDDDDGSDGDDGNGGGSHRDVGGDGCGNALGCLLWLNDATIMTTTFLTRPTTLTRCRASARGRPPTTDLIQRRIDSDDDVGR